MRMFTGTGVDHPGMDGGLVAARRRAPPVARQGRDLAFASGVSAATLVAVDIASLLLCHVAVSRVPVLALAGFDLSSGRLAFHLLRKVQLVAAACLVASVFGRLALAGHYTEKLPFRTEARQVAMVCVFAFLISGFVDAVLHADTSSRIPIVDWLLFPVMALGLRQIAKRLLDQAGLWRMPVLVIGGEANVGAFLESLGSEALPGYRITSVLSATTTHAVAQAGHWQQQLRAAGAARIAIVTGAGEGHDRAVIDSVIRERVPFFVFRHWTGLPVVGWRAIPFVSHDTMMLSYRSSLAQPLARVAKRAIDVLGAGLLLVLLSPLMVGVTLAVSIEGGAPIFAHERIGANGGRFRCLKFRTMVRDAGAVLREALARDPALAAEWAANQKLRRDPRVTRIGNVLRRTSLDELPQLLNVLRGEMSLVGPRPIVADEVARYENDIAFYYETKPGLTGLWQVSGRSETSFRQRVRLDAWYVKNWTIWHDVAILAKTIHVVLRRRGAH